MMIALLLGPAQPAFAADAGANTAPAAVTDDGPGNPCQQWGRVARGILMAKNAGQPKRKGQSPMEQQLINQIYDHDTTGLTLEAAYAQGYKTCLPVLKRGLN
jgi:hypothetical protein